MSMRLRTLPLSPFVATHTESSLCVAKCVSATPFSSRSCALFHFPYPVTPVFATHTKTAGCVPTIPIMKLLAANLRYRDARPTRDAHPQRVSQIEGFFLGSRSDQAIPSRDEKSVPANPLESTLANCDTRKFIRMCFYENCRVSLVSLGRNLKFYLNFLPSVRARTRRSFGHSHILVGSPVVKQEPIAMADHALDEDNVGDLADFFPFFFREEDRSIGAEEQFTWIVAVEDGNSSAIDELIIGAIVDEDDATRRQNRWRAWLDDARIKHSGAARKNRRRGRFGPVNQISRVRET